MRVKNERAFRRLARRLRRGGRVTMFWRLLQAAAASLLIAGLLTVTIQPYPNQECDICKQVLPWWACPSCW